MLLRRALGLGPRRPTDRPAKPAHEHDDLPAEPTPDLGDDDTQEVARDDAARR